jgi:hypothetical protein
MQPTSHGLDLQAQLDHEEWEGQLRELSAAVSCVPELFVDEELRHSPPTRGGDEIMQRQLRALGERLASMAAWHESKSHMLHRAARRIHAELQGVAGSGAGRPG